LEHGRKWQLKFLSAIKKGGPKFGKVSTCICERRLMVARESKNNVWKVVDYRAYNV
jgi:hypothetical protein